MMSEITRDFFKENSKEKSLNFSSLSVLFEKPRIDAYIADWRLKMYMKLIKIYGKSL